ncbi:aminotransferase-like domain-containing protein [Paracoccus jiaweipingae]|uniref:aminotransferase-like domain-containing protein n=1 Tax=unclassified Paracoccus (in: a-proteobacteria) TaxID=2688777 RepID=UPI0037941C0D
MPVQIYHDLLAAVRGGRLAHGAVLPGSRAAALGLGVSRATINTAYDMLRAEGVLQVRAGAAPRICAPATAPLRPATGECTAPDALPIALSPRGQVMAHDPRNPDQGDTAPRAPGPAQGPAIMAPGQPDEALFPRAEWALALRQVARRLYGGAAAYDGLDGLPALRAVLADRLAADRGLRVDADQVLITPGTRASLVLLAQALTQPGDLAAIENPGYLGARTAFAGAGLRLAGVGLDAQGLCVDAVPGDARLIYVTPSNQYPLGLRMSLARRLALLDHARRHQALVIEDDYDSEFHWRGREIPALAAHASGPELAYLGSASKVLMPGLRLGWLVVPRGLAAPLRAVQRNLGLFANLHAQAALAAMMQSGRYRTHLGRIARSYASRGQALAEALADLPGIRVTPPAGGVQLALHLTRPGWGHEAEAALAARLHRAGFAPRRLSAHTLSPPQQGGIYGLLVGFADATPARITGFCGALAKALAEGGYSGCDEGVAGSVPAPAASGAG